MSEPAVDSLGFPHLINVNRAWKMLQIQKNNPWCTRNPVFSYIPLWLANTVHFWLSNYVSLALPESIGSYELTRFLTKSTGFFAFIEQKLCIQHSSQADFSPSVVMSSYIAALMQIIYLKHLHCSRCWNLSYAPYVRPRVQWILALAPSPMHFLERSGR